ncbi:MAG: type IX secretion system protein PorQ [Bacteroidota bacterium]
MMKKILVLVLLSTSSLHAQKSTYDFLRLDMNARAAGLNGSFVSMTDDPNVLFYNPAALTTVTIPRVSVSYFKHLLDVNAGSLAFAQYAEGIGNFGIGISYIDYGAFTQTDAAMNELGSFGANELAIVGGIGAEIDEATTYGFNVKFIYSSIGDYRSSALAIDAGILYQIPSENLTVGASLLNLGRQLSTYAGLQESLPTDLKVGITKRPEHLPVLLNLDLHKLNESQDNFFDRFKAFSFGAEFLMSESFRLRLGYSNEQRRELKLGTSQGLAGFSLGGGLVLQDYLIDYAFNSYGKIGGLHRISVGMRFQ